jgi:hypothetical protein
MSLQAAIVGLLREPPQGPDWSDLDPVMLSGLDAAFPIPGRPGAAILLGPPDEVLGAPAEFNPWATLTVRADTVEVELRRTP